MRIVVIYAHPHDKSFCHALYTHALIWLKQHGHEVKARSLYKLGFNPVLQDPHTPMTADALEEQRYITWCDAMIFIYPIWWWNHPAILKGWFDRVFTYGFAYSYVQDKIQGHLSSKTALVIQSSGMPLSYPPMISQGHLFQKAILEGILNFVGIDRTDLLHFPGLYHQGPTLFGQRLQQLEGFLTKNLV